MQRPPASLRPRGDRRCPSSSARRCGEAGAAPDVGRSLPSGAGLRLCGADRESAWAVALLWATVPSRQTSQSRRSPSEVALDPRLAGPGKAASAAVVVALDDPRLPECAPENPAQLQPPIVHLAIVGGENQPTLAALDCRAKEREHRRREGNLLQSEPLIDDLLCLAQVAGTAATPSLQVVTLARRLGASRGRGRNPGRLRTRRGSGLSCRRKGHGLDRGPGMRLTLTIMVVAATLALSGCGECGGATQCQYRPGWGLCGGIITACSCPTLCPGFCPGAYTGGVPPPVPCPGYCANDAGTAATPCDGGSS